MLMLIVIRGMSRNVARDVNLLLLLLLKLMVLPLMRVPVVMLGVHSYFLLPLSRVIPVVAAACFAVPSKRTHVAIVAVAIVHVVVL